MRLKRGALLFEERLLQSELHWQAQLLLLPSFPVEGLDEGLKPLLVPMPHWPRLRPYSSLKGKALRGYRLKHLYGQPF
jgi:hypothetical protein